jgi:hypothetical protein
MGIQDWLKKLRGREDAAAVRDAEARSHETAEERHIGEGNIRGLRADELAARGMHEPNIDDAERLGDD